MNPPAASSTRADADALAREGIDAHRAGCIDDAERCYREALAIAPDHAIAMHYLGVVLLHRRQCEQAIPLLRRSVDAHPDEPAFHGNLGLALAGADRFDDAVAAHRRSIALDPGQPGAWSNLGLALVQLGRGDEAIDAFRRALAIDPAFSKARWHLAMARLARGERAWDDFEARFDVLAPGTAPDVPGVPRYRGGDPRGRTLLVVDEQGYGDTLQFARFAEALAARGARVVIRARGALASLLRTVPGVADVASLDERPRCDAWVPMMSIPGILGIHPQGEAIATSYLRADRSRADAIRARLAGDRAGLRVGLSWTGNAEQVNNRRRSCPLAALAPLLERGGIAWYSLQRGDDDGEDEIASVPAARALRRLDERMDFDGRAALVTALDLVISVCTSNAHLAGALGRPTWIMLARVPDWRWGLAGEKSGWYPTARLFRQPRAGDWTSVAGEVGAALDAWTARP